MNRTIAVREYATLTTASVQTTLDVAQLEAGDFDWLLTTLQPSGAANACTMLDRTKLRLGSLVGVIELPSGVILEILPKHHEFGETRQARRLLWRMISGALDLPQREVGGADLASFDAPLSEWLIQQYLLQLDRLIKRGLRFDYSRIQSVEPFVRGRIDATRQLRQGPHRQHLFDVEYDVYLPDRPENRLLKSALMLVAGATRERSNWQLGHELLTMMDPVPHSTNIARDFALWSGDRLLAHYVKVRPWCELVLRKELPIAIAGDWRGISVLFPMERLFERYVEKAIARQVAPGIRFTSQAYGQYLCTHDGGSFFALQPDILLWESEHKRWLLDAKWKIVRPGDRSNRYDLKQSDFYQLFAYGHKYLNGAGDMGLIFPKTSEFVVPLPMFEFSEDLRLWALPFDLDRDELVQPSELVFPIQRARALTALGAA
jgi:5-methylcytosine-specific restriction enzyme subunit McrC